VGSARGPFGRARLREGRPLRAVGDPIRDRHRRGAAQPPAARDPLPRGVPARGERYHRALPPAGPAAEADGQGGLRRAERDASDRDSPPDGREHRDVRLGGERGRRRRRERVWEEHRWRWRRTRRLRRREPRRRGGLAWGRAFLFLRRRCSRCRCVPPGGAVERECRGGCRCSCCCRCGKRQRRWKRRRRSSRTADALLFPRCRRRRSGPCPAAPGPGAPASLCFQQHPSELKRGNAHYFLSPLSDGKPKTHNFVPTQKTLPLSQNKHL